MRTRQRALRTTSTACVCVVATGFAALAAVDHGYTSPQVALNDSGVWVTHASNLLVGRFNHDAGALDAAVVGASTQIDVLQHDDLVVVVDSGSHTAAAVDSAAVTLGSSVTLPAGAQVMLGGTTLAIAAPDGRVWGIPAAALGSFDPAHTAPLGAVPGMPTAAATPAAASATADGTAGTAGVAVAVGAQGTVVVAGPGVVHRFAVDSRGQVRALPDEPLSGVNPGDALAATVVGDRTVVLDRTTGTLHLPGGRAVPLPGAATAVLQEPGDAAADVVVGTATALVHQPLDGSAATPTTVEGGGTPTAPVVVRGCAYGAWSASGVALRDCPGTARDARTTVTRGGTLRYRVNRGIVVLNDLAGGSLWLADQQFQLYNDWSQVQPKQSQAADKQNQATATTDKVLAQRNLPNRPPTAVDDHFGVRPGRTTVLPVLDNDSDPDGDVLTASLDGADPTVGTVQRISGGLALQIAVPATAKGSGSFRYTADDGRGGTAQATVTIDVHPLDTNAPPAPKRDTVAQVRSGGTVTFDVLGNWQDPDGDVLYLTGAAATTDGDAARYTADGKVTFVDGGRQTGRKAVTVTVSDGMGGVVKGTVWVDVQPAGTNHPPVAKPDHVSTVVGRPVAISPLANDTDPDGNPLKLARVDDVAGVTLTRDFGSGVVTAVATAPGTYYTTYVVTDGPSTATGLIRIDVTAPGDGTAPPVAVRDRALLPADGSVLVDVLANDTDPSGGVLVVQSVDYPATSGYSVAVIDHSVLRITAISVGTTPTTFTYTVSNGLASAQGEVIVVPLPAAAQLQAPIAVPDEVTVRAGDMATVNVLANDIDPDGAPLTLVPTLVEPPDPAAGLVFTSGNVIRILAGSTPGTYHATYAVTDPAKNEVAAQLTIHVKAANPADNTAPVPQTVVARTIAGTTVRIPIPIDGIDPDGDTVELVGLRTPPTKGRVTGIGEGWIDYEAARHSEGTDTFTYEVRDAFGAQAVGTVTVGIAPSLVENHPPVAVADTVTVRPGRTVSVPVLDNDVDPDGDPLGLVADGLEVSPGVTAKVDSGRIDVTAPATAGTYTVGYVVTDGKATADGTLTLVVDPNAPPLRPIARDDLLSLSDVARAQGGTVDVAVLDNDEDPDGTRSDLTVTTTDTAATVAAGHLRIPVLDTPQVVPYTITNPDGLTATAFVRVPGLAALRPTLVSPLTPATVVSGQTLTLDLTKYVLVAPGRTLRITQAERVTAFNGTASVPDERTISFRSADGYYGVAAVTFEVIDTPTVDDPTGRTATLTIPINVTPSGTEPPELTAPRIQVAQGVDATTDLTPYGYDPNGSHLTFAVAGPAPAGFSARMNGSTLVVDTAAGTAPGTTGVLTISASNGTSTVTADATLVAVASTARLAVVTDDVIDNANQGAPVQVHVLDNDISPFPGSPLTVVSAVVESGKGTANLAGDVVTVTPAADFVGTLVVRYRVADKTGDPTREVDGRIRLTVRGRPAAPGAVTVVQVRSHTAVLSWAAPANNGAPIDHYTVRITGPGASQQECPATTCTIGNLTNGADYTFTVVAHNAVGDSAPSAPSAKIRPDAVPDAPAAPTLAFGNGSLTVTWQTKDYAGERTPVSSVTLEISPAPRSGATQKSGVTGTSLVWDGLDNGVAYTVRLQAINGAGASDWGAYSAPEVPAAPPDAPGQPTTSMLAPVGPRAQMNVSWTAPASANGDPVSGYTLTVLRGGAPVQAIKVGNALSQAVTLDTSETAYTYTVVATNKAGDSAPSRASAPRQAVVAPGAVTGLTAQATGANGAVQLGFGAAPGNGASLAQMRYQYSTNGGAWADLSAAKQVTGLGNGSTYSFRVRAVSTVDGAQYTGPETTAAATGKNTVDASSLRPYGPLANPSVSATSGSTYVTVSASASANGCGVTLHYQVDGGGWQTAASSYGPVNVGNGYSQTHSIDAYATDACGDQSATVPASSSSGPPPVPHTWVTKGSVNTTQCDLACNYVVVNVQDLPAGTYSVQFWTTNGGTGVFHTSTLTLPSSGAVQSNVYFGYPRQQVWVVILGIANQTDDRYTW